MISVLPPRYFTHLRSKVSSGRGVRSEGAGHSVSGEGAGHLVRGGTGHLLRGGGRSLG
jgi:hypothetical protein